MITDIQRKHYKDNAPEATVAKLKDILERMEIDVVEEWQEESAIGTYSLRINIEGTTLGTNGKGVNKEYARASAYAEFFERYQNDLLCSFFVNARDHGKLDFYFCPDERIMTAEEIVLQNDSFINYYFSQRDMLDASISEKASEFRKYNHPDITSKYNQYVCLPFYSVRNKTVCFLPKSTSIKFYGSNGMSAGNTPEEAIVQGLSEILERVSQTRIFHEKMALPDIPEECIKQYPRIYEMFKKLKTIPGYEIFLKDCSFGGEYPAAALIIVSKNTNKYGVKIGCHPDFGIAMERAFTEAAQGNDITEYVERSTLDFYDQNVEEYANIENSFKIGMAEYPYEIFGRDVGFPFSEPRDVSNLSNKEIMQQMISKIIDSGKDVLIRDVSTLGFPSYHIIVPGMSEIKRNDDYALRVANTRVLTSILLRKPSLIDDKNAKYIQGTIGYYANRVLESGIATFFPPSSDYDFPFESIRCGNIYVSALCDVLLKDYNSAARKIISMLKYAEEYNADEKTFALLRCMYSYLTACDVINEKETILHYLNIFFEKDVINETIERLGDEKNVFTKNYMDMEEILGSGRGKGLEVLINTVMKLKRQQNEVCINQADLCSLFN